MQRQARLLKQPCVIGGVHRGRHRGVIGGVIGGIIRRIIMGVIGSIPMHLPICVMPIFIRTMQCMQARSIKALWVWMRYNSDRTSVFILPTPSFCLIVSVTDRTGMTADCGCAFRAENSLSKIAMGMNGLAQSWIATN